jgi:TPR repeat protein
MKLVLPALVLVTLSAACSAKSDYERLVESANSGNAGAMYALFVIVEQRGSPEHPITDEEQKIATRWLIKAGESNDSRAAQVLALCYEKGCFGVPLDHEKALYYKQLSERPAP